MEEVINDVTDEYLIQVVKDFESQGAEVTVERQEPGFWKVIAKFDD